MRRPSREITIFSLSALDVLAMATGVFVMLLVWLMPYYQKEFDSGERIKDIKAETAETFGAAESLEENIRAAEARTLQAAADAERLSVAAEALEIEAGQADAKRLRISAPPKPVPTPEAAEPADRQVISALDLVFVIDTTASMQPVLRELAASMRSIVRVLERLVPSVRVGVVAYKDRDTGLAPVEVFPLTSTDRFLNRIVAFVERLQAATVGSRTVDEDVYLGLQAALSLAYRPYAQQALIVVGDAPAHPNEVMGTMSAARDFVSRQPNRTISALFVTTPSSLRRGQIDRVFFQQLAEAGGGSFNDHAGSMVESVLLSVLVE